MKHIKNKVLIKEVEFMGDTVEIKQLSVAAVKVIQEQLKDATDADSLETVTVLINAGVVGAEDVDLEEFPIAALLDLSHEVMAFSGMKAEEGND